MATALDEKVKGYSTCTSKNCVPEPHRTEVTHATNQLSSSACKDSHLFLKVFQTVVQTLPLKMVCCTKNLFTGVKSKLAGKYEHVATMW